MIFDNRKIIGADVSFYQGYPPGCPVINFQVMKDYGFSFTIMKAGQRNYVDPAFPFNWPAAKGILPRHSYWYFDNQEKPIVQARKYWEILQSDPDGMCWIDLEDRRAGSYKGWKYWYDFIEYFKMQSGFGDDRIGIYTGYWYFVETTKSAIASQLEYFGRYPLWLASYPEDYLNPPYEDILVPPPWTNPLILQTGTPVIGIQAGVYSFELDFNMFNGDQTKFNRYFPFTLSEPPTGEPTMPDYAYEITPAFVDGSKIRPDHNVNNTATSKLAFTQIARGNEDWVAPADGLNVKKGDRWLHVLAVDPAGIVDGWVAEIHMGVRYATIKQVATPPLPVPAPIDEYILHVKDGVTRKFIPAP